MGFRRRFRAVALGAVAALFVGVASLAYLHVQIPIPRIPQPTPPPPPQLTATDFDSVSYDFLSPSVGWAVDLRNSPGSEVGTFWIVHTTDGAHRWEIQYTGTFATGANSQVIFFDRLHGFVLIDATGPVELYRSVDGGAHWTHPSVPGDIFGEITFADAGDGWVLGEPIGEAPGAPEQLFATTDGGDSWLRDPDPPSFSGGLAMRNQNQGWLGVSGDVPAVLLTLDGGRSWQTRVLPAGPGLPSTCSGSVILLPGNGIVAQAGCKSGLSDQVASYDDGLTWIPIATPPPGEDSSWQRTTFVDALHWWTMTGGSLWKSADGGTTWKYYGVQVDD